MRKMDKNEINEIIIECCEAAQDFIISLEMVDSCAKYISKKLVNAVCRRDEAAILEILEKVEEEK